MFLFPCIPSYEEVIDLSVSQLEDLSVEGNPFFQQKLLHVLKQREYDLSVSFSNCLKGHLNEKHYSKWRTTVIQKQSKIEHAKDLLKFQSHLISLQRKVIRLFSKLSDENLENLKWATAGQTIPLFFEQVFDLIPLYKKLNLQFYDKDTILEEVVMKRATAGLFQVAVPLTSEIQDSLKKDHTRAVIAIEMGKRGKTEEALMLTETINEKIHKGFIHWKFSVIHAKSGKINEAFKLANTIELPIYKQMALSEIYDVASMEKDNVQLKYENHIPEHSEENEPLLKEACLLIQTQKFQEAKNLADKVALETTRANSRADLLHNCRFLCEISSKFAHFRRFKEAREIANLIPLLDYKECAFTNLSIRLAQWNNFEEAMTLVKTISNDLFRYAALAEISRAYARFGQLEEAQNVTNMIDNIHFKKEAYNK